MFQQIAGNVFWFYPDVLSFFRRSHFYYCLQQKGCLGNLGYNECCVNRRHRPYGCAWRVVTILHFVFARLREVGKAVTWKQHGKLFYPFALEDGLGESIGEVL